MSVGERIAELRREQNMSQGDLADSMDVTRQAVSRWENGLSYPDTLNLIKLAEVLDSDVEFLATGRRTVLRRPPVVIKTIETVEKVVEKPVVQYIEKIVEKPSVQYVEKPVIKEIPIIKKVIRTKYKRNIAEYAIIGGLCFFIGLLIGLFF